MKTLKMRHLSQERGSALAEAAVEAWIVDPGGMTQQILHIFLTPT